MTSNDTAASKIGWDCVALDCADAAGVAQFYADLLGGTVDADPDGDWFNVVWDGPRIATQLAPDHESPDWPRGQQQAHLDFVVGDIVAAHERVLALGGTALDPVDPPHKAVTVTVRSAKGKVLATAEPALRQGHGVATVADLPPGTHTVSIGGTGPSSTVRPVTSTTLVWPEPAR